MSSSMSEHSISIPTCVEYIDKKGYIDSPLGNLKLSDLLESDFGENDVDMSVILGYYFINNRNLEQMFLSDFSVDFSFLTHEQKLKSFSFIDKWVLNNLN